ncbi:MAG: threonine/serine dehydratase [Polaromonas sp.]|jgi:threonine dehydratase
MVDHYQINSCSRLFSLRYSHFIHKTPLWKLPGRALGVDCAEVWLKLEHLQTGGSFKARGMLNRLISNAIPASGVVIASGGNAGIAVAAAAKEIGVRCEVFVPEVSSAAKRDKLAALGATVVVAGKAYAGAAQACVTRQIETGALMAHAYDQPEVLVGSGTLALEIEEQGGVPDAVLVSVGGGGLIGGVASWFMQRTKVVALEPELAPTLHSARQAGQPVDVAVSGVAADSLGAKRIGDLAWEATQAHVRDALLLTDESIRAAQLWLWKELKLAVEPAAALPLAALHSGAYKPRADEKICLIICGANVDLSTLA